MYQNLFELEGLLVISTVFNIILEKNCEKVKRPVTYINCLIRNPEI